MPPVWRFSSLAFSHIASGWKRMRRHSSMIAVEFLPGRVAALTGAVTIFFPLLTTAEGDLQKFGAELTGTINPMWLLKNLPNNVLCHVASATILKEQMVA